MGQRADDILTTLLVVRVQNGDPEALRELVLQFDAVLRAYVRHFCGSYALADDVVQEVWLTIVRQFPRLRQAAAFKPWVYQIARRQAFVMLAKGGRTKAFDNGEAFEPVAESGPDFGPEDAAAIHEAMGKLSLPQQEVLHLRFVAEFSYEEMAQVMDCPLGTVRSRLNHAKTELKNIIMSINRPDSGPERSFQS